jgi:hypothetical protein
MADVDTTSALKKEAKTQHVPQRSPAGSARRHDEQILLFPDPLPLKYTYHLYCQPLVRFAET